MSVRQKQTVVAGGFDNLRSPHIRFLEAAAKFGELTVLLWSDAAVRRFTGAAPKYPEVERQYFLRSIRFVSKVELTEGAADSDTLTQSEAAQARSWVVEATQNAPAKKAFCAANKIEFRVIGDEELTGFPDPVPMPPTAGRKKVIATGSFDWFHSGHVRFFEEVSAYGDLYVVVGHDANIRLLKGEGHPLLPENERRYVVGSIRFVKQALVSSGEGWLDAEPEILRIKPDIYAVNEDGDKGGKREFCERHGIEYLVLKRAPAPGLPQRTSTDLRGF